MIDAAHAAGLGGQRDDDIGWVVTPEIPVPALNAVRPIRQHSGLADRIPDVLSTYPDHVPVGWWLMSDDGHDELVDALSRSGFELAAAMPAVAGPIPTTIPVPPSDLVLSQPAGDKDWEAVAAVQRDGFVSHRAGVAGLWSLTTIPSARGAGVGSAIVGHRLAQARARGSEIAFMFSGGDAEPLYTARGFRRIGTAEMYVLAPRA